MRAEPSICRLRGGLVFAKAIGLEPEAALEVLTGTMAYSRIMDTKGRKMVEGDFRVQAQLSQHLKDIRLILAATAEAGQELPLSQAHCRLRDPGIPSQYAEGFRIMSRYQQGTLHPVNLHDALASCSCACRWLAARHRPRCSRAWPRLRGTAMNGRAMQV
ncbi:MAG: NAD(P)-dependent oxidoreductase [Pirellulales bacterium]|nr:NAD(P)-dependent oxidoreductase [Pirellulales bacterium]